MVRFHGGAESFYLLLYTLACQINITHLAYMKHVLYATSLRLLRPLRVVVAHFLLAFIRAEKKMVLGTDRSSFKKF